MAKQKAPWVKPRHKFILKVLTAIGYPYVALKYHIKVEKFREEQNRPLLILYNHQTAYDQFFVAMAFEKPIYFIASEDIFSLGWASRAISWLVNPIPIKKQTSDLRAVRTSLQAAKEGGSVALAPEGNRTFDGKLCYINPAILGFIRLLKLPVAIFRIEGGYGIHPRWSDVIRKGSMKAYTSRVIEHEEIKGLSDEELMDLILSELNVDETQIEDSYFSSKNAEYLERAIYVCPDCGLSRFESQGDKMECKNCGMEVRYLPDKTFERTDGNEFPFRNVADWYAYQCDTIRGMDLEPYYDKPVYEDTARLSEVVLYDRKNTITENAVFTLYGNRLAVRIPENAGNCDFAGLKEEDGQKFWHFDETDTITVLGKNKLNIYVGGKVYQIKADSRFNALKYVNIFNHYKNISKGENHGEQFLGL